MAQYEFHDIIPKYFSREYNRSRWNVQVNFGELIVGALDAKLCAEAAGLAIFEKLMAMYDSGKKFDGSTIRRTHIWKKVPGRKQAYTRLHRAKFFSLSINGKWPRKAKVKPKYTKGEIRKLEGRGRLGYWRKIKAIQYNHERAQYVAAVTKRYRRNMVKARKIKTHYTIKGRVYYPMAYSLGGKDSGMLRDGLRLNKVSNIRSDERDMRNLPSMQSYKMAPFTTQAQIRISCPKALLPRVIATGLFDAAITMDLNVDTGEGGTTPKPPKKDSNNNASVLQQTVDGAMKELARDSIAGSTASYGTRKKSGLMQAVNARMMLRFALNVVKYLKSAQ